MKIIIYNQPSPLDPLSPIPTEWDLYEVKPDQEMWSWEYKVRPVVINSDKGLPAVNRTGEFDEPSYFIRSNFSKEWQFFWADLLSMRVYGKLLGDLSKYDADRIRDLTTDLGKSDRFLTNYKGLDNCNNYLYENTQNRGQEPKIDPLICAGSLVRVLDVQFSDSLGMNMAKLWTFKSWEVPPPVTRELLLYDPRILRATNIFPDGHLAPFDQIYLRWPELREHWVPYPYISSQNVWFPERDLRKV